jgi:hypothetical protein
MYPVLKKSIYITPSVKTNKCFEVAVSLQFTRSWTFEQKTLHIFYEKQRQCTFPMLEDTAEITVWMSSRKAVQWSFDLKSRKVTVGVSGFHNKIFLITPAQTISGLLNYTAGLRIGFDDVTGVLTSDTECVCLYELSDLCAMK